MHAIGHYIEALYKVTEIAVHPSEVLLKAIGIFRSAPGKFHFMQNKAEEQFSDLVVSNENELILKVGFGVLKAEQAIQMNVFPIRLIIRYQQSLQIVRGILTA